MTEIYLARHGETPLNLEDSKVCGHSNHLPLTKAGEGQAFKLGQYIASSGLNIDAAYSSTAVRAYTTAEIALSAAGIILPITPSEALLEMSQGEAEGKPRHEVYTPSKLEGIATLGSTFSLPGAESVRCVRERILEWILESERRHPDQTLFVVGHGLATRCAVGGILDWPLEKVRSYATPNCSLTKFMVQNGKITVPFVGKDIIGDTTY